MMFQHRSAPARDLRRTTDQSKRHSIEDCGIHFVDGKVEIDPSLLCDDPDDDSESSSIDIDDSEVELSTHVRFGIN